MGLLRAWPRFRGLTVAYRGSKPKASPGIYGLTANEINQPRHRQNSVSKRLAVTLLLISLAVLRSRDLATKIR